jgi:hypothetical protein
VRLTERGKSLLDLLAVLAIGTAATCWLLLCWSIGTR